MTRLTYLYTRALRAPGAAAETVFWLVLGLVYLAWAHRHPDPEPMLTGLKVAMGVGLLGVGALYVRGLLPPVCECGHRHWDTRGTGGLPVMAVDLIAVAALLIWIGVSVLLVVATGRSEERRPKPKTTTPETEDIRP